MNLLVNVLVCCPKSLCTAMTVNDGQRHPVVTFGADYLDRRRRDAIVTRQELVQPTHTEDAGVSRSIVDERTVPNHIVDENECAGPGESRAHLRADKEAFLAPA